MLGYVRAHKPSLTVGDYQLYKGVYCTLCRTLGRRYSPLAQLFLSYDFTLYVLLRLALKEEKCVFKGCRCPYNPAKKCLKCTEKEIFNTAADALIITVYYKLKDDLRDRGLLSKIRAVLLLPFVSLMHKKAKRLADEVENIVAESVKKQQIAEKENYSVDRAADPSAKALADIFSMCYDGKTAENVSRLGYMTGRFVYILDAADDLEKDVKAGNFNPFSKYAPGLADELKREEFAQLAEGMLNLTASEALEAFDKLQTQRFGAIIENIICDGIYFSAVKALEKYRKESKKSTEISV